MAKDEKKTGLKVAPGKKEDSKDDLKSKAKSMLLKHPEVMNSARHYFHNENGKTIIEEMVPRGDPKKEDVIMPRVQGDLKEEDLRELAVFASSLVDETLKQYDQKVAYEDALQRAIGSKDGGKYSGKVNCCTFDLILDQMGNKSKKASDDREAMGEIQKVRSDPSVSKEIEEDKSVMEQALKAGITPHQWALMTSVEKKQFADKMRKPSAPTFVTPKLAHKESSKEATMDKALILKELEATRIKMAALEVLAGGEVEAKEMPTCDKCSKKHWPFQKCSEKSEKKEEKGEKKEEKKETKEHEKGETKKEEKEEHKKKDDDDDDKSAASTITSSLDEIAGTLEAQNDPELMKIAFQLDLVSDVLEGKKEASTLEGDLDEKYMKQFFHAGVREKDSDEQYMKAFDVDKTTELKDKFQHKQLGKDASSMPYKIVK